MALVLAARSDFVQVQELARISLGLKTGADKFFFLRPGSSAPTGRALKGNLFVAGYESWRGTISSTDLLPALVGPQQMYRGDDRRFVVQKNTGRYYLYPRAGRPRGELGDYIDLGELGGLPQQSLVKQNGGKGDWYRQTRSLVRAPWALPYNSAYDYGAWDNTAGAVLNGRFLGAEPFPGIDTDLLGAVLNSTFAMIGRLTEGMATGTEGAFDAGPPAVRRIRVPDIRRVGANDVEAIKEVLKEIRGTDTMPAGPASDGSTPKLRRRLDEALLVGLGLSRGKSAVLLDNLYASYARWRRDVQEVELQMRRNRRQMNLSGRTRTVDPAIAAGRRVWEELAHETPLFPSAYLLPEDDLEEVNVPRGATLPDHPRLIEPGVLSNGEQQIDLGSHDRLRYLAMLQRLGFTGTFRVVRDPAKAAAIVKLHAQFEASLLAEAVRKAVGYVGREAAEEAAGATLDTWARACRQAGMGAAIGSVANSAAPTVLPPVATH